jgi:hypothetical protein
MEDLDVQSYEAKVCRERIAGVIGNACSDPNARRTHHWRSQEQDDGCWLEAGSCCLKASACDRDAAIFIRRNDCGDHEGFELAAALGARLPCRRGAQTPQAEARLEEGRRQPGLSDHQWREQQAQTSEIHAPVVLNAMPRVKIGPFLTDRSTIDVEITRLRDLGVEHLRNRWHTVFGRRPHPYLPRHLLFRVLAYRLQANVLGDLDGESQSLLDGSASSDDAGRRAVELASRHGSCPPRRPAC